jgi:hypothetical protein
MLDSIELDPFFRTLRYLLGRPGMIWTRIRAAEDITGQLNVTSLVAFHSDLRTENN